MKSNLSIPYITNFSSWESVKSFDDFSYPWQNETPPRTIFQAYNDNNFLHIRYTAYGPKPLVYVETNHKLEVTKSERVEIFFRKNTDLNPYYCFEIDPNGRVLDYEAKYYREFNREWTWPGDLKIKAKIKEDHYIVEGQFEKSVLQKLGLLRNNILQAGLYRGQCVDLKKDKAELKWISWIDSGTDEPDFHVASSFGQLILSQPD